MLTNERKMINRYTDDLTLNRGLIYCQLFMNIAIDMIRFCTKIFGFKTFIEEKEMKKICHFDFSNRMTLDSRSFTVSSTDLLQ